MARSAAGPATLNESGVTYYRGKERPEINILSIFYSSSSPSYAVRSVMIPYTVRFSILKLANYEFMKINKKVEIEIRDRDREEREESEGEGSID